MSLIESSMVAELRKNNQLLNALIAEQKLTNQWLAHLAAMTEAQQAAAPGART